MASGNTAPRLTSQSLRVLKLFVDAPSRTCSGAEMMKATGLSSGTLYPILLRFEEYGLLESSWEKEKPQSLGRPRRRLYSVTGLGLKVGREALSELGVPGLLRPAVARA
jgi:PadR family transcriptional regulator